MAKQTSFKFRTSGGKDIDNVAFELTESLQILTTNLTRGPLNQATEHYINLNRLLMQGVEVTGTINALNSYLPEIVEAFLREDDRKKDPAGPLLERARGIDTLAPPAGDIDLVGSPGVRTFDPYARNPNAKSGRGRYVYDAFVAVRTKVKVLFDKLNMDMGHQEVTPISVQLALVAEAYQNLEDALSAAAKTPAGAGRVGVASRVSGETGEALQKAGIKTVADIRKVKKKIQKLMLGFELMQKVPYVQGMKASRTPFKDLIQEYNKLQKMGELDVQTLKDKIIDTAKGKVRLELRAESKAYNQRFKPVYEKLMQRSAQQITQGKETAALKNYLNKIKIGDVKGSPAIEDKIVKDITDIARGKKVKASKTKTTKTKKVKTNVKGKKLSKANLTKLGKASTKGKAILAKGIRAGGGKKGKTGRQQLDLAKIQIAINQKLPAEVRRNMGRPALINQTGRFSNSVRLTGLRQAPNSVVADYTYQLNPYETFENNGVRQWPTGYNPKPLISKSIRNLAAAFIDQKFTLRRV